MHLLYFQLGRLYHELYIKKDAVIVPVGAVVEPVLKSSVARQQISAVVAYGTFKSQLITRVSPDLTPIFAIGVSTSVAVDDAYIFK